MEWKPVPSMPGVMANDLGQILLPQKTGPMPHGGTRVYKTKPRFGSIAKARPDGGHRRRIMHTRAFGTIKVHRAVCEAFHGPPQFEGAVVIHRNEDSTDNRPTNIKWGTQKENLNAPGYIAYCKTRTGENSPTRKGIKNARLHQSTSD